MIVRKKPFILRLPKSLQLPVIYVGAILTATLVLIVLLFFTVLTSLWENTDRAVSKFKPAGDTFDLVAETWIKENVNTDIFLSLPFILLFSLAVAMLFVKLGYLTLQKPLSTHKLITMLACFGWLTFLPFVCFVIYHKKESFLPSQIFDMLFMLTLLLCLTFHNKLWIFMMKMKDNLFTKVS